MTILPSDACPSGSYTKPVTLAHNSGLSWEEVEEEDDNMLVKLPRNRLREEFLDDIQQHTSDIGGIVAHHLSLSKTQQCRIADRAEWLYGDFNACIPITVSNWRAQRLLLRCPFPHMVGQPFGLDEKIRCEAATFAWISSNCSEVPTPRLWGFGLPNGLSFKHIKYLPWYRRILQYTKNYFRSWFSRTPYYAPFIPTNSRFSLQSGYLLVDFIEKEQGRMLSEIWPPDTDEQKQNFYKSLSKIMLELARCPLPTIGSFTVHNSGEISLSNRPLTVRLPLFEGEGIPIDIPRDRCYLTTESYVHDLLKCLDSKLRYQPNSVRDEDDARAQMACLTTMRYLSSHFILDMPQTGPFYYIWTDPHASNIFVNEEYKISSLPDLEWFCSLPIQTLHIPFWLAGHDVDEFGGENKKDYRDMCTEFLTIFQRVACEYSTQHSQHCTEALQRTLEVGTQWYWASLYQPRATYNLFLDHLQPQFAPEHSTGSDLLQYERIVAQYWTKDAAGFIKQKLREREDYLTRLRLVNGRSC
ncbi:hypothetical protein HRR83_000676 [Exophiala dermatitidis]|uniref:Aminoglycoside phosphotransferase domain-containing protein n=1 Tax=Exophiala dermatitidis TaxID=5970 RepID=A0AAN6F4M2_EXODE|nr:hypothetical protein HRR74_000679 [Exophiala dermatitidis]KAJ4528558.1 hypothetical protein HRR73_001181 [Exophiala dermatitidis]KAJ4529930.1 hypothetical protein HRR76_009177 [Exophiala dermatitidis]KAJ4558691.1 hypothetical protein HRR77_000677 [Exophiala dermatitidis]KAJ4581278.1 hypothetical protein HRR79_000321 [Exophiala dermatitidis]